MLKTIKKPRLAWLLRDLNFLLLFRFSFSEHDPTGRELSVIFNFESVSWVNVFGST